MKTKKWKDFDFNRDGWSDSHENHSDAFAQLVRDIRSDLKKMVKDTDWEVIRVDGRWFDLSAFLHNKVSDKYVYVSIGDVRWNNWWDSVLVRSATSDKDFRGGINNYTSFDKIVEMAERINKWAF